MFEGFERGEDELQRGPGGGIFGAGFEVLHEDTRGDVHAEGHEWVHLGRVSRKALGGVRADVYAYRCQVLMADHLHDVGDLVCGDDAPPLALGDDLRRHLVLFGLKYGRLVQTDGGGVDGHVAENHVGVENARRKPEMARHRKGEMEESVIVGSVPLPVSAIEVAIVLVRFGAMEMG